MSARLSLPRGARLLKAAEFDAVFASGRRHQERLLSAVAAAGTQSGPRLGLAISKKAIASAVGRNRVKRITRESFRHQRTGLPVIDVVVSARPAAATAAPGEIRDSLTRLWKRITEACAASSTPR